MVAQGFSVMETKAGQALRQLQGGSPPHAQGGGGGQGGDKYAYPLPDPRDLVLLELALEKLETKAKDKVTQEEARAVARVCWEKAEKTAYRLCKQADQKDYPSTALRRLLLKVYQRLGDLYHADVQEHAWASQSALHMLGPE
ncbi:MAG: hypothetical protein H5T92_10970, partial [Synergistales bacterium]|nr:hypothetical protein [Synergistales bacterium]